MLTMQAPFTQVKRFGRKNIVSSTAITRIDVSGNKTNVSSEQASKKVNGHTSEK